MSDYKKKRIGEKYTTTKGYIIEIVDYNTQHSVTIKFEDGTIVKDLEYCQIKRGNIRKPENRVGLRFTTNEGYIAEITEYFNSNNCTILLNDGNTIHNINYKNLKIGVIRNHFHKSIYNVGYLGIGKHRTKECKKPTKVYNKWFGIMERCYSEKYHKKQPTYINCSVDERWHNFQVFGDWYDENYNPEYMQGWALDKDILVKGNKIYSPETCCFVPQEVNNLFNTRDNCRGTLPIGVLKCGKKYSAGFTRGGVSVHLGVFNTPTEAFEVYKTAKEEYIKEVADEWRGQISEICYHGMLNYTIEIND